MQVIKIYVPELIVLDLSFLILFYYLIHLSLIYNQIFELD